MGKIPVTSLAALLATPPPEMLVQDLVVREGITGVSANENVGKTWFCLEMARAVVTGTKFLGRFDTRPGAVCFIGQDASIQDYARQVRKLIREQYDAANEQVGAFQDDVNPFDDRLKFIIHPGVALVNVEDCEAIIEAVNNIQHDFVSSPHVTYHVDENGEVSEEWSPQIRTGVDLIIMDTYAALGGMANENDNSETQRVMRHYRAIAQETKAAIVLTHHHPNANQFNIGASVSRWRGGSAARGSLDGHIELSKRANSKSVIDVAIKKFRGIKIDNFAFTLEVDEERASLMALQEAAVVPMSDAMGDSLLEFIQNAGRVVETAEILGFIQSKMPMANKEACKRRVSRYTDALRASGKIKKLQRGHWVAMGESHGEEVRKEGDEESSPQE